MCLNFVLDEIAWIWAVSDRFLLEIRLLRAFKAAIEQKTAHLQIDVYFLFSYNPELDVMFVLLQIFDSATNRIDSKMLC